MRHAHAGKGASAREATSGGHRSGLFISSQEPDTSALVSGARACVELGGQGACSAAGVCLGVC